jgi:hypothetical protein
MPVGLENHHEENLSKCLNTHSGLNIAFDDVFKFIECSFAQELLR